MESNRIDKAALKKELRDFDKNGVKLSMNGIEVRPGVKIVNQLLAETECTYMRNYIFQGEKIIGIEFDKVNII